MSIETAGKHKLGSIRHLKGWEQISVKSKELPLLNTKIARIKLVDRQGEAISKETKCSLLKPKSALQDNTK